MPPELSQRTLGYVRDALYSLEAMEEQSSVERQQFWKQVLFDEGFAKTFIDMAASYQFNWTEIIPDLYTAKFGLQNNNFSTLPTPYFSESWLRRLVVFASAESKDTTVGIRIRESLKADGFPLSDDLPETEDGEPMKEESYLLQADYPKDLDGVRKEIDHWAKIQREDVTPGSPRDSAIRQRLQQLRHLESRFTEFDKATRFIEPAVKTAHSIDVFISHSSADTEIARALIELLRSALPELHPSRIRCTSVAGYKLVGGTDTNNELRRETQESRVFIGLLTKQSLQSTYVLFELGARWGAGSPFTPLVAAGLPTSDLKAPLSGLHAHSCDTETDLHQMLDEISNSLNVPKVSTAVYNDQLQKLAGLSRTEGVRRSAIASRAEPPTPKTANDEKRTDLRKRAIAALKSLRSNLPSGYIQKSEGEYLTTFNRALDQLQEAGTDVGEWRIPRSAIDELDDSMLRSKIDAVLLYF